MGGSERQDDLRFTAEASRSIDPLDRRRELTLGDMRRHAAQRQGADRWLRRRQLLVGGFGEKRSGGSGKRDAGLKTASRRNCKTKARSLAMACQRIVSTSSAPFSTGRLRNPFPAMSTASYWSWCLHSQT